MKKIHLAMLLAATALWVLGWPVSAFADFGGPGSVVSVVVEGGDTTTEREIVLLPTYWEKGTPTHYRACEDPQFTECEWKAVPYFGGIRFTLSEGYGPKTIYFVAKRFGKGASEVMTIKVNYVPAK